INGNEVGSVDYNVEELNDSEVSLYIGAGDSPHWTYTGLIDELRIWETARTQQELKDSMMKSLNGNEAGLNALYSFEGNAKDSTANGNNGEEVIGTPEYVDGELSLVSSTSPSTTRSLRITAPDATTHEVIYDMTDTSVDFPSLGLQVNTSNLSNMTSILLNNPHTFTINPTLEVTPPVGPTVETEYSFNNNSQTIDFSGLDIDVHTNNAQAMTNTLLDNSEDFTINPTLKIVAPDGGTTQEIQYNANNNSQTIDFSGLGIDIHTNNAQAMTNALLNSSGSFTIDTRLKATAPDGTQQEIQYPSSAQSQTVSFNTLGLELDSSDAEQTATQLLNSSQGFTVNTRLKATAPDGTQQEIQYPSSAQSQTVSFNTLGLELDSSNAEQTATQLLNHSQGFTIDTRLKATAPDGTQQEIQYPSSSESQTVSFSDLGLDVDSNNAQTTATQLLNHSQIFRVNPTMSVTAHDNTVAKSVYEYDSNSQTVNLSGLGLQVETDNAIAMTSSLLDNAEDFTVDARLKATAPSGTTEEIKYSSSSELQTVSFDDLGLEIDSNDAQQTATQLLNHSQEFTVDTRLKATIPDGTQQEIKYSSSSESQTVSFSDLGLDVDSYNAQTTATQLLNTSRDFTVNPTLAINSPNTAPVEESGYQFHDSPQTVGFSRLGLEVDTSNAPKTTTTLLGAPQDFFVPETRKLTMTGENGMEQSLEYRVGYDTTLNFDEFGI
ncbi:TPA: hypothetical protein EYO77_18105, partial [Candidatus Poribacteria bacterium]|nr:hypothetical protein [Candidatus Poribacteria bacterium]